MTTLISQLRRIAVAGVLLCPAFIAGCAVHARYYDGPHGDYHYWGSAEVRPYASWEVEVHRPHTDYKKLKPGDRQAYWNWRHDHP